MIEIPLLNDNGGTLVLNPEKTSVQIFNNGIHIRDLNEFEENFILSTWVAAHGYSWKIHERYIQEYPGEVFVLFDPTDGGSSIIGAYRSLDEAKRVLRVLIDTN